MMKAKAYVVANCQVRAIEAALSLSKNFTDQFEFVEFAPVHVIKPEDVARLHDALPGADLLLAQFVTEAYRNNLGLGTETLKGLLSPSGTVLTWPSIYWAGYNPELFYLKDKSGASFTEQFDYHHRVIFAGYLEGRSADEVGTSLLDPARFTADAEAAEKALQSLATREAKLDLKAAPFISENYQSQRLFWTFNHPSQSVILDIARQVLDAIGLENDLPAVAPKEVLNSTIYPILPGVHSALGLRFKDEGIFTIRNKTMSAIDTVDSYYRLYEQNSDLIELNRAAAVW